jgi:predicted metalloenzyme YecM
VASWSGARQGTTWSAFSIVHQRTLLERHARANRESVWNGRPISLIVLAEPLDVFDGTPVSRIELIPPVHQRVYRMGLEHRGVVVGDEIDEFSGCIGTR